MKVIQIAATPDTANCYEALFALCDDGSIWCLVEPGSGDPRSWMRLPDISDTAAETPIIADEK